MANAILGVAAGCSRELEGFAEDDRVPWREGASAMHVVRELERAGSLSGIEVDARLAGESELVARHALDQIFVRDDDHFALGAA